MKSLRHLLGLALVGTLTVSSLGCIKAMLINGQIEGTRKGAQAMNTTSDFEVARIASTAGLAQFEGMHRLAPDNQDGYYLLVKGYASYAFAFVEDDMEQAYLKGDDDLGDYHKARAKALYTRAIGYGTQWMEKKHAGFEAAAKTGDEKTMQDYLAQFDDESDADLLFWTGQAWMGRTNVTKEAALVGTVYVGKNMIERVVALQPDYENGSPYVLLASFNARTGVAMIGPESFVKSKELFEKAKAVGQNKILLPDVQMAMTYACRMGDDTPGRRASFELYGKLLAGVLNAEAPDPDVRLLNAIAKRKARRYLSQKWIEDNGTGDCGWEFSAMAGGPPVPPVTP
ncbi:MAG: TRAP transporter TatT component family protein [Polyangiales bacterium]